MSRTRYQLQRADGGNWWYLGSFETMQDAWPLYCHYDPDGTVAIRLVDTEEGTEVPFAVFASAAGYREGALENESHDWRKCGF